jgi:hypothetical protein
MTVPDKAEVLAVARHLKACLARMQQVSDFMAGDDNRPDLRPLIDAELLDCNARLDEILRERSMADH